MYEFRGVSASDIHESLLARHRAQTLVTGLQATCIKDTSVFARGAGHGYLEMAFAQPVTRVRTRRVIKHTYFRAAIGHLSRALVYFVRLHHAWALTLEPRAT